jgi:hypothetical protein
MSGRYGMPKRDRDAGAAKPPPPKKKREKKTSPSAGKPEGGTTTSSAKPAKAKGGQKAVTYSSVEEALTDLSKIHGALQQAV